MPCYLPYPYDDELLYSAIARYFLYHRVRKIPLAINNIFGHYVRKPRIAFPASLDYLAKNTNMAWNMSPREIANQLTLFPYYARYLPEKRAEQCFQKLCSNYSLSVPARLGITQKKNSEFLRYCQICRESDILKNGETFWRRSHQIEGVLMCPQHGEFLVDSKNFLRPEGINEYIDATVGTSEIESKNIPDLNDFEKKNLHKISRRCQEMLCGPIRQWESNSIMPAYRRAAFIRGYGIKSTQLDQIKLETAFFSFYGEKLLSMLNIKLSSSNDNWFRTVLRTPRKSLPPLKHAVLQIFLESMPIDESARLHFENKNAQSITYKKRKNESLIHEKVLLLRMEWEELLSRVPNKCPDLAYEINPKLYRQLLRIDKKWLYIESRLKIKSPFKPHINWETRDKEWSTKLENAALQILTMPHKRVTKSAILKKAGLDIFHHLNYLPRCREAINRLCETSDVWQERRIRAELSKLCYSGRKVRPSKLKKLFKGRSCSPRISELIEELCLKY